MLHNAIWISTVAETVDTAKQVAREAREGSDGDEQAKADEAVPDVPDGAVTLLETLREHGEPATRQQAYDLVTDNDGPGLDVSERTVRNWVNDLRGADALVEEGRTDTGAQTFRPR